MPAAPRTQRDFHLESALESNRTGPTGAAREDEAGHAGFTQELLLVVRCAA